MITFDRNTHAKAAIERIRPRLSERELTELNASVADWQPRPIPLGAAEGQSRPENSTIDDVVAALDKRNIEAFRNSLKTVSADSKAGDVPIIFLVVAAKDNDFLRVLLEAKPSLDVTLPNGMTLLHIAAGTGQVSIIESLIRAGASEAAAIQDKNGAWPFQLAEKMSHTAAALLLKAEADKQLEPFVKCLETLGYSAPGAFSDPVARHTATKVYQRCVYGGHDVNLVTGFIDRETLTFVRSSKCQTGYFRRLYTFEQNGQLRTLVDMYRKDVPVGSAAAAREDGLDKCRRVPGRKKCEVHPLPPGGCLAIAAPSQKGTAYHVSPVMFSKQEAAASALTLCGQTNCSILNAIGSADHCGP